MATLRTAGSITTSTGQSPTYWLRAYPRPTRWPPCTERLDRSSEGIAGRVRTGACPRGRGATRMRVSQGFGSYAVVRMRISQGSGATQLYECGSPRGRELRSCTNVGSSIVEGSRVGSTVSRPGAWSAPLADLPLLPFAGVGHADAHCGQLVAQTV